MGLTNEVLEVLNVPSEAVVWVIVMFVQVFDELLGFVRKIQECFRRFVLDLNVQSHCREVKVCCRDIQGQSRTF